MTKLKSLLGIGTILLCLSTVVPAARADFGDALLGAAVGAGISAAVDDDDDGTSYRREYRSFAPTYRRYRTYRTTPFRSWDGGYRSFRSGLPYGSAYFVDEGQFRNYKDAYGNHLGREPLW